MEKTIENRLRLEVKKKGGIALKFTSPGNRGVPDRIVLLPGGKICFVELKDFGKKPDPLQVWWHSYLRGMGFEVLVIDSIEQIKKFIDEL